MEMGAPMSQSSRRVISFKTASHCVIASLHNKEEERNKRRFLTDSGGTSNSGREILLKAVERRDVWTVLNCLEEDSEIINENITVGSNISALYKPWSQFIIETLKDEEAYFIFDRFRDSLNFKWSNNQKKNLLHIAAEKEMPLVLDLLLQVAQQKDVLTELAMAEDNLNFRPVHYAALRLAPRAFEVLLRYKIDLTVTTNRKETVLTLMGTTLERNNQVEKFRSILKLLLKSNVMNKAFLNMIPTNGTRNSALHYVTAFGDLEDVKSIVELGALPELNGDCKSPFHVAAEHGKSTIMRFLLDRFASGKISFDIDQKDKDGNTCLHTALYNSSAGTIIVRMLIMEGAKLATVNQKNETPLDLIFQLVQYPGQFLLNIFDHNVEKLSEKEENSMLRSERFEFRFNYQIFNPWSGGRKGERQINNFVLSNLLSNIELYPTEGNLLLNHPLLESFILKKWQRVKIFFNIQFLITFFFVFAFSCFTSLKCLSERPSEDVIKWMLSILAPFLLEIILVEMFLVMGRRITLIKLGRKIKLHLHSLLKVIVLGLAIANLCISSSSCEGSTRTISAFSVLLIWVYFFSVISINPHIGTETLIFLKVGSRLTKLLIAYSSIIFGFYFAFSIVFPDHASMNHMLYRFNTVITMTMGELSMDALANGTNFTDPYAKEFWSAWKSEEYSGHLIYAAFCFTCPVLILNILTAFAIKDVEEVLRGAEINKLKTQAEYLTFVEQSFLSKFLDFNIPVSVTVKPGVYAESNKHFDKKLISKWQEIFFDPAKL